MAHPHLRKGVFVSRGVPGVAQREPRRGSWWRRSLYVAVLSQTLVPRAGVRRAARRRVSDDHVLRLGYQQRRGRRKTRDGRRGEPLEPLQRVRLLSILGGFNGVARHCDDRGCFIFIPTPFIFSQMQLNGFVRVLSFSSLRLPPPSSLLAPPRFKKVILYVSRTVIALPTPIALVIQIFERLDGQYSINCHSGD